MSRFSPQSPAEPAFRHFQVVWSKPASILYHSVCVDRLGPMLAAWFLP
jgi:hypothetical protein